MTATDTGTMAEEAIPVASLNRYTFCPRLFHLMYVQGRWEANEHTEEGTDVHRRVDRIDHLLPEGRVGNGEDEPDEGDADDENGEGDDPLPEIARSAGKRRTRRFLSAPSVVRSH